MKRLMEKGVDIYSRNHNGSNALHIAVKKNNLNIVLELLKIQYPLDHVKNNGITAAGIAAYKGHIKLLDLLTQAGADITLSSKVPVYYNDPVKTDSSPVFFAIKCGNLKILEMMLDTGFDLTHWHDLNQIDPQNETPLSRYVMFNNFDLAKKLISRGAKLDFCNKEGKTVIVQATQQMRMEAIQFLIQQGANPHIMDFQGNDACDYARINSIGSIPELNNCDPKQRMRSAVPQDTDGTHALSEAYNRVNEKYNQIAQKNLIKPQSTLSDVNPYLKNSVQMREKNNSIQQILHSVSPVQSLNLKRQIIQQQTQNAQQQRQQVPLFLREDFVYGEDTVPPEPNFINPLQYVYDKSKVNKEELKKLDEQIAKMDFETQNNPYEKQQFEADLDYKQKVVEQENKIQSIHQESDQLKSLTNQMTSIFENQTNQFGLQSVALGHLQNLKESVNTQNQQKLMKQDFEGIYRMKKQQEQLELELDIKKRERDRKLQVQEFENVTNRAGLKLEELRRNIQAEIQKSQQKQQISRNDEKLMLYNSTIARELRTTEMQNLRSNMVQQRKHSYINGPNGGSNQSNLFTSGRLSTFDRATNQTINVDYNPYQSDVLHRLQNLSSGKNKKLNTSDTVEYSYTDKLVLPKVNFVDTRSHSTIKSYGKKDHLKPQSYMNNYDSTQPVLIKNSSSQKSITYDPYTSSKMSSLIDRLNVSSLRELDKQNIAEEKKEEATQYYEPYQPPDQSRQDILTEQQRQYLENQKNKLDYQMYLNQQQTNDLVYQIKDKLDRIGVSGQKRSLSQPKYNYSSMLKAVGKHTAQNLLARNNDRNQTIVKPIVGANPQSGFRLASDIRAQEKIQTQLSRNHSNASIGSRTKRSNHSSPNGRLMTMKEIQLGLNGNGDENRSSNFRSQYLR
ncbi:ankyrin [Stylonychia lemnae]|uniref:Ankyrin n=1 Tax=Stylonychia lemnae TaxID=5949 RepID=A0A078AU79_STYLE|nr:ankyrin [Stylonychia lemnae]|eukprot:CDW84797.1 ankyrin [Stylonychia lemnae]